MGEEKQRVLILGYGEMGQAMEYWLRPRHELALWQRRPAAGAPLDLAAVAANADAVLFCVPAAAHAELAARLKPALRRQALCLSIAKGLDDLGRTAAQVLHEALGDEHAYGVLYGPMIAEEIRAGRSAFAEYASRAAATHATVRRLFAGVPLVLHFSADVFGASWCAVLKNAYAILFGVADGLALGDNMRGYLAVEAVREIEAIVTGLGGAPATPWSLAGLGDLITTATSPGSHHHGLGRALARREPVVPEGEGVHTLKTLYARRPFRLEPYPLLRLAYDILAAPDRARTLMQTHLDTLCRGA